MTDDDLKQLERFREYLADLYQRKLTPPEFAEKWYVFMEVSKADAQAYYSRRL